MGLSEPTVPCKSTAQRATSEASVDKMNSFSKSEYYKMGLFVISCLHFSIVLKNSGVWITRLSFFRHSVKGLVNLAKSRMNIL